MLNYEDEQKNSYLGHITEGIGPAGQATADIDQQLVSNLHLHNRKKGKKLKLKRFATVKLIGKILGGKSIFEPY